MAEKYGKVLEQYDIDVYNTYKSRGALMAVSVQGELYRVTQYNGNCYHAEVMAIILNEIRQAGFLYVPVYIKNNNDTYITTGSDRNNYIITTWYEGRECDVMKERDVLRGCQTIAALHNAFDRINISNYVNYQRYNIYSDYERHLRELKRIKSYLAGRINKTDFEQLAFYNIDKNIIAAQMVVDLMCEKIENGIIDPMRDKRICHGDFDYHSLINGVDFTAVTGFEKIEYYIDIWDFYNFLRKVMEKNGWNIELGLKMIQEYDNVRHITDKDYIYLKLMLLYPEKFWKILNYYYNSKKVWIPDKNTEKLNKVVHQTILKTNFIKRML